MARRCSVCTYCRCVAQPLSRRTVSFRKQYFCTHPALKDYPSSAFKDKRIGYIGQGDLTLDSNLTLKTHPRWCPMELFSAMRTQE